MNIAFEPERSKKLQLPKNVKGRSETRRLITISSLIPTWNIYWILSICETIKMLPLCLLYSVLCIIHENSKGKKKISLQMWTFCVLWHSEIVSDAYILSVIGDKILDGLWARYMLYRGMPLDLVIGERLVRCTLVLTRGGTPSRQNLGPSGPQRIDFVLCK